MGGGWIKIIFFIMDRKVVNCSVHEKEVKLICTNVTCCYSRVLCEECILEEIKTKNSLHFITDGAKIEKIDTYISEFKNSYTQIKRLIKEMHVKLEEKHLIFDEEEVFTDVVEKRKENDFSKSLYEIGLKMRGDFFKYFSEPGYLSLIDNFIALINSFNGNK